MVRASSFCFGFGVLDGPGETNLKMIFDAIVVELGREMEARQRHNRLETNVICEKLLERFYLNF